MNSTAEKVPVVGILYPGEMGSTLGKLLVNKGVRVVTTVQDRSPRTQGLCKEAGLEAQKSLGEVVSRANVILSLVTPGSALTLAEDYCQHARWAPPGTLFVDVNSLGPETAKQVGLLLKQNGIDFVDGAIHGLAAQLQERGTLYLSGARAAEVAELLGKILRTRVVGAEPGQASAFKMFLAGMSKGLAALFMEMSLLARRLEMLEPALAEYRHYYPALMDVIERLVPTYPQHAGRRAEEMQELEEAMRHAGQNPTMIAAARTFISALAKLRLGDKERTAPWTVPQIIEELFHHPFLQEKPAGNSKGS